MYVVEQLHNGFWTLWLWIIFYPCLNRGIWPLAAFAGHDEVVTHNIVSFHPFFVDFYGGVSIFCSYRSIFRILVSTTMFWTEINPLMTLWPRCWSRSKWLWFQRCPLYLSLLSNTRKTCLKFVFFLLWR